MVPRDCQTLAGSLLGFLATRAESPLLTFHVFSNMLHKCTNLHGEKIYLLPFEVQLCIYYVTDFIINFSAFCSLLGCVSRSM